MATVEFRNVCKVFDGNTRAVDDFSLTVANGELLVLVGPSGCGKSTILRMLAGLEQVSSGEILIDGECVNARTPQERNIAMVFQNYALYPHMSVRRNLEFPLKMMKLDRQEISSRVEQAAALLDLTELLERKPKQLSGGQRQRVAMGRALVRNPRVFLMDEPLSNLDAKLRIQIRTEIAALQRRMGTTTIYVTHDQTEAMTLGHHVAVLSHGRLQQVATPQQLYQNPANIFVAGFVGNPGMNLFPSNLKSLQSILMMERDGAQPEEKILGLRPEAFFLESQGSDELALDVDIQSLELLGHELLAYFSFPEDTKRIFTARLPGSEGIKENERRTLYFHRDSLFFFDAQGIRIRS